MLRLHHVLLPWHRASIPVGPFQKLFNESNGRTGEHPSCRRRQSWSSAEENLLWMFLLQHELNFTSLTNPSFISQLRCYSENIFPPKSSFPFPFHFHEQTRGFLSWWPFFHFRKSATSFVCLKRIITPAMKCWWAEWRRPYLPYGAALRRANPSKEPRGVTSTCLPSEPSLFYCTRLYLLPLKLFLALSWQR